jgi:tetratricopeptide (TPR) repeat protein
VSVKSNSIKKKALEFARKRDWKNAIKEYNRLAELEQTNPNIFNELGDLHLKAEEKSEAFKSYEKAIAAYKHVGLFNNAIAVCKKIMRLNPNHVDVLLTLGQLRKAQGITKEAAEYFISYLDRMALAATFDPEEQKEKLKSIVDEMPNNTEILERVSDHLIKHDFRQDAGDILCRMRDIYCASGQTGRCDEIEKKLAAIGYEQPERQPSSDERTEQTEPVFERNGDLWSKPSPSSKDRGETEPVLSSAAGGEKAPASIRPKVSAPANALDYGTLDLSASQSHSPADVGVETIEEEREAPQPAARQQEQTPAPADEAPPDPVEPTSDESAKDAGSEPEEDKKDKKDKKDKSTIIISKSNGPGSVVHVSKIIDEFKDEVQGAIDTEDHHTHYDLGMAYLEMDLLSDAVREFQLAAKAPEFQVSSLEMIGLCFIKQNQPRLAIKQLERGLSMIGSGGRELLGLLYTLGVAYEMMGDDAKAKCYFEDVYVVDVSFRNVAEKIKKYSSV